MHEIKLKPSRRLGLLLAGMVVLALLAIGLAALTVGMQLAMGAMVIGLAAWGWLRVRSVESLRIAGDGRLQGLDDSMEWRDVKVLGDSFVSPGLIVLRYRMAGQVRTLTLLPDSTGASDLRRIRVSLRWTRRTRLDTSFPGGG